MVVTSVEGPDVSHASRFKLSDVYGNECCHPDCYAPPYQQIASLPVPLCETHIFQVYKATSRFLNSKKAREQEYQLHPLGAPEVLGPCISCGHSGFLTEHADNEVVCRNASCGYKAPTKDFHRLRRRFLFTRAGKQNVVYYVRFRDRVKIGTTGNLFQRLRHLPVEEIVGYEPGDIHLEKARHEEFNMWRIHHEWFEIVPSLKAHINNVTSLAN